MGLLTMLAVVGMASAIYVARSTHGEAGAVNMAGSLRMQAYRIAATLEGGHGSSLDLVKQVEVLIKEFEQRLTSPRLAGVVDSTDRKSLHLAYHNVEARWHEEMLPLVRQYTEKITTSSPDAKLKQDRLAFHNLIASYVSDIDRMVQLLEEDAESSIHMLGLMQGISLMLSLYKEKH